jgi:CheY-like chemotaxis protein
MIVDDDDGHALLIQGNLEEAGLGHRIERLRDGQAALDFFFDDASHAMHRAVGAYFVLLDIRMPRVDGIEVLRRLKADPYLKKFPVVMLTTAEDDRDVERCYELGCSGYVKKPIEYDLFADAVRLLGHYSRLLCVPELSADRTQFTAVGMKRNESRRMTNLN